MNQWHLLQFKPNSHRLAERNLQRQGFETFLPMQVTTQRKSSRFVSSLKPLLPGYMFVSIKLETAPWRKINSTLGVSRLLTFNGNPTPIPLQFVSSLMQRCDTVGKLLPPKTLNSGDNIKILNGPFANFVATIEAIDAWQRVWILIDFMGQKTKIHVAPDQVQLTD